MKSFMYRLLFAILCILLLSCTANKAKDKNIQIIIDLPSSYKYDLNKRVYTIFFLSRPPLEVQFSLTDKEWDKIVDAYYSLELDELKGKTEIGECLTLLTMPHFQTMLNIKTKLGLQQIKIENDCDDFPISVSAKAGRINKFLDVVFEILKKKKEIQNAPNSDIMYI
jgi:hypothetical protein